MSAAWPGVDLGWSRRITVPSTASIDPPGSAHTWHLLDTGPELEERGITPAGTLLCVHGNPTWSYLWRSLLRASLTESARNTGRPWRVVAVDQLDMGFSDRTGRFRRLEDRITDLGDLTAALQISGPVVTVGHDWGGIISLGWASRHRDQLAAVVLTNTAVHQPAGAPVPAPLKAALHPAVHGWGTTGSAAFLRITHSLARPRLSREVETAYMSPYRRAGRRAGVGNFVADIPLRPSHPSFPTLEAVAESARTLDVPALLLWGPQDPVFSDRYLRDLIDRFPQADVHRFEGAGHLVLEDRDVAGTVMHWLDRAGVDAPGFDTSGPDTSHSSYSAVGGGPVESTGERLETGSDAGPRSYQPMWTELDRRSADPGTAVVDMSSGTATGAPGATSGTAPGETTGTAPDTPGETSGTATGALGAPKRLSWAELSGRVRDVAGGLSAVGVRPGDRVNLLVPPGSDLTTLIYACLRIGAVIVVADAGLGTKGLSRAVKGAGPQYIIGIERGLSAARLLGWPGVRISVDQLPAAKRRLLGAAHSLQDIAARGAAAARSGTPAPSEPGPDDQAAILFTSGSTGPAKGVVYTHRRLDAMRATIADTYGLGAGTALVAGFAPFALLGPALGATTVTPDMDVSAPKTLTAAALADAAQAIDATAVFASPSALRNVLDTAPELTAGQRNRLGSVKLLLSAGAPIGEALLKELTALLPAAALHTPYGMTEALPVTDIDLAGIREARLDAEASAGAGSSEGAGSSHGSEQADGRETQTELARSGTQQALGRSPEDDDGARVAGAGNGVCVGRAVRGASIAISALDDDGAATAEPTADPAVTGEILVRAPHVKSHYDRLWATEQISSQNPGWHRTGDVGHLDASGRLWVEGRLGHIIATAGGVLTPVALEQAIEQADGVARAAVVGVGPHGAQVPAAVLETLPASSKPGLAGAPMTAAVRAAVAQSQAARRLAGSRRSAGAQAPEDSKEPADSASPVQNLAAVLVVPELPTDIRHNAKIDRARLAQWATDVLAGGKISAP